MTDFFADLDTDFSSEEFAHDNRVALAAPQAEFRETCQKCRGTGRFLRSISGGKCYACDGVGYKVFKTSRADRMKAQSNREERKVRTAAAWNEEHAEVAAWIEAATRRGFRFAAEMGEAVRKYGSLTEKQLAACERFRIADAQRDAERSAAKAQREASAPVIDVGRIEASFETARAKGYKRMAIRVAGLRFAPAPLTGQNAGAIYVKSTETGEYLGKVQGGKFRRSFVCTPETEAEVVRVASDPEAAAILHGKRTGECAICGKELTVKASIERGIGPKCAARFGW